MDGARAGEESVTGAGEGAEEEAVGDHAAGGEVGISSVVKFAASQFKSPM